LHGVRNGEPWGLFLEDDLRLAIERVALFDIGLVLGLDDQVVEWLETPFRRVAAAHLGAVAAEQDMQEVVGIAVVAGPTDLRHLVLAVLQPLAVLAPFIADDRRLDADLGEVGLHQLADAPCVGIVSGAARASPRDRSRSRWRGPLPQAASSPLPDRRDSP